MEDEIEPVVPEPEPGPEPEPDSWPAPPAGLSHLGYLLLIAVGALIALSGVAYLALALVSRSTTPNTALALAVLTMGLLIVFQGKRALEPARWRELSLAPGWVWGILLVSTWAVGALLVWQLPDVARWVMPPLILLAAGTASFFFLSLALHGLRSPAGRAPLSGRLVPRHVVLLSAGLSATFSTLSALILELIVLVIVFAAAVLGAYLLGDTTPVDLFPELSEQDPLAIQRLEEWVLNSPLALAALATVLVFIAPAIEETVKGLPLLVFLRKRPMLTERTAILIGVAGGVGFAFAENAGYLGMLLESWAVAFWLRAAAAIMHGVASGFVGRAWYRGIGRGRWLSMLLDWGKGWGVHALWNGIALLAGWFAYKGMVVGVLLCALAGLVPLVILLTWMVYSGIWVRETPPS